MGGKISYPINLACICESTSWWRIWWQTEGCSLFSLLDYQKYWASMYLTFVSQTTCERFSFRAKKPHIRCTPFLRPSIWASPQSASLRRKRFIDQRHSDHVSLLQMAFSMPSSTSSSPPSFPKTDMLELRYGWPLKGLKLSFVLPAPRPSLERKVDVLENSLLVCVFASVLNFSRHQAIWSPWRLHWIVRRTSTLPWTFCCCSSRILEVQTHAWSCCS